MRKQARGCGLWCSLCERSIRVGFPAKELVFCPRCYNRMYLRDEARRMDLRLRAAGKVRL